MMNIELKALIAALLISGTVVSTFLGTAHILQSNTSIPLLNRLRKPARSKIPKSRPEQSCLPLIVRIVTALMQLETKDRISTR
jgi:hypothetical protein